MPGGSEIDDLDLRIIAELQDDGRKPTTEIARALDVPRTTIARRIERLIAERVITVGVLANGPRIGLPIQVIVEVLVDPRAASCDSGKRRLRGRVGLPVPSPGTAARCLICDTCDIAPNRVLARAGGLRDLPQ